MLPIEVRSDHTADFRATITGLDLAGLQASVLQFPSLIAQRTAKLIRQGDPEVYHWVINLQGEVAISQHGRTVNLGAGEMTIYSASRPFTSVYRGDDRRTGAGILVALPRAALALSVPIREVDRLITARMSARSGVGALACSYLTQLASGEGYSPRDHARLASITVDLIVATLAHQLDAADATPGLV